MTFAKFGKEVTFFKVKTFLKFGKVKHYSCKLSSKETKY